MQNYIENLFSSAGHGKFLMYLLLLGTVGATVPGCRAIAVATIKNIITTLMRLIRLFNHLVIVINKCDRFV